MSVETGLIRTITIPKIAERGFLLFAQTSEQVPFPIERVYWILGVNSNQSRGFHAHKQNRQLLFCIQGSIDLVLNNGREKDYLFLDKPETGVIIEPLVWHEMHGFRKDTILLVLASQKYNPDDYIRDYQEYLDSLSN